VAEISIRYIFLLKLTLESFQKCFLDLSIVISRCQIGPRGPFFRSAILEVTCITEAGHMHGFKEGVFRS